MRLHEDFLDGIEIQRKNASAALTDAVDLRSKDDADYEYKFVFSTNKKSYGDVTQLLEVSDRFNDIMQSFWEIENYSPLRYSIRDKYSIRENYIVWEPFDDFDYQKAKQEEENGAKETSYEYKIKDASGKTVSEYELKWEVENRKTEMSVEFTADGAEREFEISVHGENSLKAEYESDDGEKLSFTIDKNADGTYVFRYENGYSEVVSLSSAPVTEKS